MAGQVYTLITLVAGGYCSPGHHALKFPRLMPSRCDMSAVALLAAIAVSAFSRLVKLHALPNLRPRFSVASCRAARAAPRFAMRRRGSPFRLDSSDTVALPFAATADDMARDAHASATSIYVITTVQPRDGAAEWSATAAASA